MVIFFPDSINFYRRIVPKDRIWYLGITRLLAFLALFMMLFQPLILLPPAHMFFTFFTNWGMMLTLITFALLFISTCLNESTCISLHKFAYLMFEISLIAECVITLFFWGVLVPYNPKYFNGITRSFITTEFHSVPFFALIIEFSISRMRFQLNHIPLVFIPALCYMIFSIILSHVYDIVPYPMLDWKSLTSAFVAIGLIALFLGFFMLCYFIGKKISDEESNAGLTEFNPS